MWGGDTASYRFYVVIGILGQKRGYCNWREKLEQKVGCDNPPDVLRTSQGQSVVYLLSSFLNRSSCICRPALLCKQSCFRSNVSKRCDNSSARKVAIDSARSSHMLIKT
ncbi:hypothetical protein TNCT_631011 [Trichonephila clavata]|uniref:Uncharacterized protein n=1 Tax=Trichonephila clavata TaxID=2740835 RepID=A0A8X6LD52_TRICU|nr:hypothetical protein TNCT_631011 [Trichonephila clavata]